MINYDEKMVLNSHLVIKMGIDQIGKNFVKSMSVKKFSYLGQFIRGFRNPVNVHTENIKKVHSCSFFFLRRRSYNFVIFSLQSRQNIPTLCKPSILLNLVVLLTCTIFAIINNSSVFMYMFLRLR